VQDGADQLAKDLAKDLTLTATGDRDAFAALYRATSAKLFGVILRILHDRSLAADVLQEVYVKIWNRASSFDATKASAITWMTAVARNRALDEARKRKPQEVDIDGDDVQIAAEQDDPLAGRDRREEMSRLVGCLEGLDAERRRIVVLAYCRGLSREELAAQFAHPVSTIKTWLRRSLTQLRECLDS